MSRNEITEEPIPSDFTGASPFASNGFPRIVSDDETTRYPAAKRTRNGILSCGDGDRRMETDHSYPLPASLPSQDDVLMEVCYRLQTPRIVRHDLDVSHEPMKLNR